MTPCLNGTSGGAETGAGLIIYRRLKIARLPTEEAHVTRIHSIPQAISVSWVVLNGLQPLAW